MAAIEILDVSLTETVSAHGAGDAKDRTHNGNQWLGAGSGMFGSGC